ncbi:hypothetical protein Bca52824_080180 [Brassica carinata]|uniref:AT-hook motif nuclear-localized protein n=1 Tax=Brassica carinata TaxID=52824 RepID=A0A8X7U2L6_BRACI|nr:hypothetical protein Bca52824_080180 [Brassica carinata]
MILTSFGSVVTNFRRELLLLLQILSIYTTHYCIVYSVLLQLCLYLIDEGRFEILSLTCSFMQNDTGGTRSRAGGMSVCLAGPDGRVFGGGLAGLFLAAGPVRRSEKYSANKAG